MFDGSRGRRIYGPQDVAKGARIATQEHDFSKIAFNADSYAIFAQAFYWRNIFGSTPQPTANASMPIPTGLTALDVVADAEDNYVDYDIGPETKPGPIVPSSAPPAATASSTTTSSTPTLGVKPTG